MNGYKVNDRRGITLIALLITVIVILILVGVTVRMTTGDNGLIKEAKSAKEEMELKNIEQAINRSYTYLQEESDNAFEEAIKELKADGYKIKIINEEYYVMINEKYRKIFLKDNEIKVDMTY